MAAATELQYQAMRRLSLLLAVMIAALSIPAHSDSPDLQQVVRRQYQGKIFLLRGFLTGNHLYYDGSGIPISNDKEGDWTADGLVSIDDLQIHQQNLIFHARRLVVTSVDHKFLLRPALQGLPGEKAPAPATVEITADLGTGTLSAATIAAVTSKIFLGEDDSLADLVPAYWRGCVRGGLMGRDAQCRFSPELLSIPGVLPLGGSRPEAPATVQNAKIPGRAFHVGNGVSPPKPTYSPEPEFSEAARGIKFQGTVTLGLIVDSNGATANILILSPLGAGLDAKAVHAVEGWKFKPAEKDGQPVSVEIAVEVNFRLF
jgi:TonB family protein